MSNRLAFETSPYLLQHADNPVDWYPWGEEAFAKAKKENKPVFLSIGYSTCHWCHVMAHESFEDSNVAKIMNKALISIKVDREERPDIDKVYMSVCQMMTGSGGWPLTIIMTPDKKPFFAATYIPKETRHGRTGLLELIPRISELWSTQHAEVLNSANKITDALRNVKPEAHGQSLNETTLDVAYEQLGERFDEQNGGFGGEPKFPTSHNLLFLLRYWKRTGNDRALEMVNKTLLAMRNGGIYDHLGFGFHRYSTDSQWLVPHFEKMLYDQALLAIAYTEAYQATKREEYSQTASEILDYVLRNMTAPEGGFYSAEDADSEGEEGKFYLWTHDEMGTVLSQQELIVAMKVFNISKTGNFSDEIARDGSGRNILFVTKSINEHASELGVSSAELSTQLDVIRKKLFNYREKRIHPHKDDKILTDWNGLMIAAMAKASQVFNEPRYSNAAMRTANYILENASASGGRLLHGVRHGVSQLTGNADDYAFLIFGLLELYEATFDIKYLKTAIQLNNDFILHFWDRQSGGFYFTPDDGEQLLSRQKEIYDGAVPSANSVAMSNLLKLGRITTNSDFEDKAEKTGQAFSIDISNLPSAYTQLLVALDFALGPSYEVVVVGDPRSGETNKMLDAIRSKFVPNKIMIFRPTNQEFPEIDSVASSIKQYRNIERKTTAYVCHNFNCELPTTDVGNLLRLLGIQT